MVGQFGRLQQILAEIAPAGETIDLVFVDWATTQIGGHPLRAAVDVPILPSAGASIGQAGFFEVICDNMIDAALALNPIDRTTRHIVGSYAMETPQTDGTVLTVDLGDPDQYAEVKAFLQQMID